RKCEFNKISTTFLGYTISSNSLGISDDKVKAKTPKIVKEIQSFLGFVNFYY
ncbi:hypothetical protein K431DRAFT_234344, partial [Polychaeton citri CBS 116435]